MKWRALIPAALVVLLLWAAASADATVVRSCYLTGHPENKRVCVEGVPGVRTSVFVDAFTDVEGLHVRAAPGPGGDVLTASGACTVVDVTVVCPGAGLERVSLYGKELGDVLDVSGLPAQAFLGGLPSFMAAGEGDDTLIGSAGPDTMHGQGGNDYLNGGTGAGSLYGEGGEDVISFSGASLVYGGSGRDVVTFAGFAAPVTVTLGTAGGDGIAPAYGQIRVDVEDIVGGAAADTITTSNAIAIGNHIMGGPGNDRINPGGGGDVVEGNEGDDLLTIRDGVIDQADCGPGNDRVILDRLDAAVNCESVSFAGLDDDRDGYPTPRDCDDVNPKVNPGRREIPRNGVDDDCKDGDAPFSPVPSSISIEYGGKLNVTSLLVRQVLRSTWIEVRCRGRSCPFKKRTRDVRARRSVVKLTRWLRGFKLTRRSRLEVRVVAPERLGKVRRERLRRGRIKHASLCLDPRRVSEPVGILNLKLKPRRPRHIGECG